VSDANQNPTGDQDVPLVPGEVRAYRLWKVTPPGRARPWLSKLRLQALYAPTIFDPDDQRTGGHTATCQWVEGRMLTPKGFHQHKAGTPEQVPEEKCQCGFYGTYTGGLIYAFEAAKRAPARYSMHIELIVGSVLMAGRCILGEQGVVRAEKMRIEALFSLPASWSAEGSVLLSSLGLRYQVPTYTNPAEFEMRYPQADLAHLAPNALAGQLYPGAGARFLENVQGDAAVTADNGGSCQCPIHVYKRHQQNILLSADWLEVIRSDVRQAERRST
jgi:hypothetical protein